MQQIFLILNTPNTARVCTTQGPRFTPTLSVFSSNMVNETGVIIKPFVINEINAMSVSKASSFMDFYKIIQTA